MRNVIPIMMLADRQSLVLLDELGAGTDPMEGAPLAMAILEELHRGGVRTMATTHYSRLKTFAYQLDGVENASMEFDVETLSPTYKLMVGLPGRSNALEIADRLGMPEGLVRRARSLLTEKEGSVEELIAAMEEDRKAWSRRREEAETEAGDARILRKRMHQREQELRGKQEELIDRAREDARRVLREARAESRELLREIHQLAGELKQAYRSLLDEQRGVANDAGEEEYEGKDIQMRDPGEIITRAESLREVLDSLEERIITHVDEVERRHLRRTADPSREENEPEDESQERKTADLRPGMNVKIGSFSGTGELIDIDGDQAHVQVGVMKLKIDLDDIEPTEEEDVKHGRRRRVPDVGREKYESLPSEIVVRKMNVEQALEKVRKHIDDAILAGRDQVTIVHGHGEGILREAIRRYLEETRYVRRWQPAERAAGGDGVTIAHLR